MEAKFTRASLNKPTTPEQYEAALERQERVISSLRSQLERAPIKRNIPDGYCIVRHDGSVGYTVSTNAQTPAESADWARSLCHEHINDMVGVVDRAGEWLVRPFFIGDERPEQ